MDARVVGVALIALSALPMPAAADCVGGWETRAPMGVPRQEIGVAAMGDLLYAVGGFDAGTPSAMAEVYDANTDRWAPITPLPLPVHHPGAAVVGDKLYVVGGLTPPGFTATDSVFEYDSTTAAWRPRARLPAPRGAMGVAVIEDRIYAAGGVRGSAATTDFAVYDPGLDQWTALPPMPTAREHLAAAAIGGIFYAVGGRTAGRLIAALEAFDPARDTWRTGLAPLPTPRGGLMAAALGGRLFTFGGEGNPDNPRGVFPHTEAYDVATDLWTTLDPMPVPRHGTVAAAIGDRIYVPGGASRQGFGVSGVNEVFAPPALPRIVIGRARLRGLRLRVRGRIDAPGADVAAVPVVVRLSDQLGAELASLSLPAGSFGARGRRLRYRAARGTRGIVRLTFLRERGGSLRLRVGAALVPGSATPIDITLTVTFGDALHCGAAPLRRTRAAARRYSSSWFG